MSSRTFRETMLGALVAVTGLCGGYSLGRWFLPGSQKDEAMRPGALTNKSTAGDHQAHLLSALQSTSWQDDRDVLDVMERTSSAGLRALAEKLVNGTAGAEPVEEGLRRICACWAARDPCDCFAWLSKVPYGRVSRHLRVAVFEEACSRGKSTAEELLVGMADFGTQVTCLSKLISAIAKEDPGAALTKLSAVSGRFNLSKNSTDGIRQILLSAVAETQPGTAFRLALQYRLDADTGIGGIGAKFAIADPDGMKSWIASASAGRATAVAGSIAKALEASDPAAAVRLLQALPVNDRRTAAFASAVTALYLKDPAAANRVLAETGNSLEVASALSAIAVKAAKLNPENLQELAAALPSTSLRTGFWQEFAGNRGAYDPEGAFDFGLRTGDPTARTAILDHTFKYMNVAQRTKAIGSVLDTLHGSERDLLLENLMSAGEMKTAAKRSLLRAAGVGKLSGDEMNRLEKVLNIDPKN